MALGKPVIATNGRGTLEIIIDGENGLLIPPKSITILAEKMEDLLRNPALVVYLGKNATRQVKEKFTIDRMVNLTYYHYENLLSK